MVCTFERFRKRRTFPNTGETAKHPFSENSFQNQHLIGKEGFSHLLLKQFLIRGDQLHVLILCENISRVAFE